MKRKIHMRWPLCLMAGLALAGCAELGGSTSPAVPAAMKAESAAAASSPASAVASRYVLLGEQGQIVARVLTRARQCPLLEVDGKPLPMQVRSPAGPAPYRETVFGPELSKVAGFPVLTCEAIIAAGSKLALLEGQPLPLPPAEITRIVVLGDSGCRIRENKVQDCTDPREFPFAKVAQAAANWKPQLVVHVGDYHYRENPCPDNTPSCKGSPWGYGWDVWKLDFFEPASALLQAAPWVMVRGNHESCGRAGQGWWRWLDPRPLIAGRDCDLPQNDVKGDYSEPYAVPLGGDAQLLVFDSSGTPEEAPAKGSPEFAKYSEQFHTLERLSNQSTYNFAASHHPLLGLSIKRGGDGTLHYEPGNAAMQGVFGEYNALLVPPRVQTWLAGHVHTWQQLSFSSGHPNHFISGAAGSALDPLSLPAQLPPGVTPAVGAVIASHAAAGGFGFMTMERDGPYHWQVRFWDQDGKLQKRCEIENRASNCQP